MIDKIRPRKLNATADSRLRKEDEMQDALNLVSSNDFRAEGDTTAGNDGTGNAGVLKPTKGNTPINFPDGFNSPTTDRRVLGSVTDHAHNVIYFFVWYKQKSFQGVYAYDPDSYLPNATPGGEECVEVFRHPLFNFPSNGFIKADIVHINKPFKHDGKKYDSQPVLYFTDNKNEPRKLHPFRALTEDFSDYELVDYNDFITACPKTPVMPITANFERDVLDETSSFEGLPGFQFAYQHIYKGGEESALSTFSDIAVPQAYYNQGSSVSADLYANNKCVLTIPSSETYANNSVQKFRTLEVAEVRILRRIGNSGTWAVVDEVTVEELEENDNTYNFYNRSISSGFPSQAAIKPYDNLPQKAEAQAIVSDRLTYGNYVEGYDNVRVTASASVTYHERPEDFKELEITIEPTIKFSEDDNGQIRNKRAGYYINTENFPGQIESGSLIQFDFSVKPNRNFHIYNSNNSFHGSRHLTVDDEDSDLDKKVRGDGATDAETRVDGLNKRLDQMFGSNNGVSIPGLKWQCVDSQDASYFGEYDVVFGTSAANPFILRGSSLHFSVKVRVIETVSGAQNMLRETLTNVLSGESLSSDQEEYFEVVSQNNIARYQIDEGIDGGGAFTTKEESILPGHEIPVAAGGDDRKHLIVSLGNKAVVHSEASDDGDLRHQSPCGYFIVNKAQVGFGLNKLDSGFLELDLRELNDLETLTAIPFINAERWKDEAYESGDDGAEAYNSLNDSRNWGIRDATVWSLDSLIVDSWFCYSRSFLESANFHEKIYTPTPTDFPRYMNGSAIDGLGFGELNAPESTNDGQGKNAAIVNIDDNTAMNNVFIGDTAISSSAAGSINDLYRFRWNSMLLGGQFKQSSYLPYLQAISIKDNQKMRSKWAYGRNLIIGFIQNADLINLPEEGGTSFSILDGAIGPGGSADGGENIRKVQGDGTNYAVGSVTGEMIFAGRLAARGFIRPEKFKEGAQQVVLGVSAKGWDNWFHQYGLGPVLPYFGGVGYQFKFEYGQLGGATGVNITDLFSGADVGYINNWLYKGAESPGAAAEFNALNYQTFNNTGVFEDHLAAKYMGDDTHAGEDENQWAITNVEQDLEASASVGDAPILLTGREFGIFGGTEWSAGGRSFKTRASHTFGIVYYDERGRSGKVNPLLFKDDDTAAPPSPGVYVKGYGNSERSDKGRVSIEIDLSEQTPPDWAFNYQIVYGGNTTKGNFIQYSTGGAFIANKGVNEEGSEEAEDPSSTNIYVSLNYLQGNKDVSYAEAFGAVSPLGRKQLYTYKPGDKLRVLSYYTDPQTRRWTESVEFEIAGVETVTNNPEENIFRRAFELDEDNSVVADCRTGEFLILKNNTKAEGFNYTSVKAAGNKAQTTAHRWNDRCVVEIYSPLKEADIEDMLFYETGEVYNVSDSGTDGLVHHPSSITLNKGDVWFKPVALAAAEWGDEEQDEDGNSLDSYLKFKNLIRRGINEGESSPRFKNYYVESMTFNDTFAGNNVIGIGKPNNVDTDVFQVRKPSSVIYSDKQDFSKRGLRFSSFNGTASNWKDLPREHGAINYLLNNYDSLTCIQENKSSNIPVERNIISDASGSNTLITSNKVVGVQTFYAGEYGCDNNPESVVKTDEAVYFASKAKSEVYRLTHKGIQVISKEGMSSYFFRIFEEAKKKKKDGGGKVYIPGGYDPLKDEFLITVSNLKAIVINANYEDDLTQGSWGEYLEPDVGLEEEDDPVVFGCTDSTAENYDPDATIDDGTCSYPTDDGPDET